MNTEVASAQPDLPATQVSQSTTDTALSAETVPPVVQIILCGFLAYSLTLVNRFIGMFIPLEKFPAWGQHIAAITFLAALLFVLMRLTRAAALLKVSGTTLMILAVALAAPTGTVLLLMQRNILAPEQLIIGANSFFLPIAAALAGTLVGRIIKHPNTLLAAAGFALFFDCVVVTLGTVAALAQSGSNIISLVSVGAGPSVPHNTHKTWQVLSAVTIGPADVLFLSVFFASVFLMRLESRATFRWIFGLLVAALAIVEWQLLPDWLPGIPALLPMGIAVILANRHHAAFTERERKDLVIGAIFAFVCAGIIVWRAQSYAQEAKAKAAAQQKRQIGIRIERLKSNGLYIISIVAPDSRASDAGLRAGDVVQKINGTPIEKLAADEKKYQETLRGAAKNGVVFTIKSGDQPKPRDVNFPPLDAGKPNSTPQSSTTP